LPGHAGGRAGCTALPAAPPGSPGWRVPCAAILLLSCSGVGLAADASPAGGTGHVRHRIGSIGWPPRSGAFAVLPTYTDQPVDGSSQRILGSTRPGHGSVWMTLGGHRTAQSDTTPPRTLDADTPGAEGAASSHYDTRGGRAARRAALEPLVREVADAQGIEAALLLAIVDVESGFDVHAISAKGARGLAQMMPATAARYGHFNLFSPHDSLTAGSLYLRDLLKLFGGDLRLTLAAYNAGEAAVQHYDNRIPPFAETRQYVPAVLAQYYLYRKEQSRAPRAARD
jgi:soluble lytic murein transglycosylase-like protein